MARGQDGRIAGKYLLREKIGEGAMGVVWRAHDESLGRDVAIKEIRFPAGMPHDQVRSLEARTLREARAAARLSSHPGIVVVHEVVYQDDRPWIVMELVRGRTLEQVLKVDGPLPPRQVAVIGASILAGLRAAHAAGIVHRDVKPSNIMFDGERTVITDFGIAALDGGTVLTQSGTVMGTPSFMAPEQARGEYATPATDLWALGATMYYAVEGRPPFDAGSVAAVLVALLTADPAPPMRAGPLATVIAGLLVKDPAGRTTAPELAEELAHVANGGQVPPRTLEVTNPGSGEVPLPPRRPRRPGARVATAVAAALGTGLATVALVAVLLSWLPDRRQSEAEPGNSGLSTAEVDPKSAAPSAAPTVTVTVTPAATRSTTHTVTYKVGGSTDRARITYSTPSGSEQSKTRIPWQKSFKASEDEFDFPQVSAQNQGGGEIITCEIYVDGVKVKAAKSTGEYTIASCDGGI